MRTALASLGCSSNRRRAMLASVLAAGVLLSARSEAAPDALRIGPFAGPKASVAQKQLKKALCARAECVLAPKKGTLAKKAKPTAVLSGKVAKDGKKRVLELVLLGSANDERLRREIALGATGGLAPADLQAVSDEILGGLAPSATARAAAAGPAPLPQPAKAAAPVPASAEGAPAVPASPAVFRAPAPVAVAAPPASPPAASPSAPRPAPAPEAGASAPVSPGDGIALVQTPGASRDPMLALSLEFEALRRDFAIQGLSRGEVADSHTIGYFPMAAVRVALHPWVAREGALRRLGFTGAFAYGAGVSSKVVDLASGTRYPRSYPHTYLHGEGAADFAIPVTAAISLTLSGGLSLTRLQTGEQTGSDHLSALPDVGFLGPKGGVGLTWQGAGLRAWGGASAVYAISSGPIVSEDYFTDGSTVGLEGTAGAAWRLGPAELSLRGTYTRYALSFSGSAEDAHLADGATDQYFVGSAGLGFLF